MSQYSAVDSGPFKQYRHDSTDKMRVLVFILISIGSAIASPAGCPSKDEWIATLDHTDIEGCTEGMKFCPLIKGSSTGINITFTPQKEITKLEPVVFGIIADVPVGFKVPNDDGCKNSGLQCPLKAGEKYTYVAQLPVEMFYPTMKLQVKWELRSNDEVVTCNLIRVQIKNPKV